MNESVYDRLKYLLMEDKWKSSKIIHLIQTVIKEIKLFPARAVRIYNKLMNPSRKVKTVIRVK